MPASSVGGETTRSVRIGGAAKAIPEIMKIGGLTNLVPAELAKEMEMQNFTTGKYSEVKDYVMRRVNNRKETWFSDRPAAGGVAPMDLDKLEKDEDNSDEQNWEENGDGEDAGNGYLNALKGNFGKEK